MSLELWLAYALACFLLPVTPGPPVLLTAGQAISRGFGAGFAVVLGTQLGNLVYFILSAAGIGAILNVVAGRLSRTVDRSRSLATEYASLGPLDRARVTEELHLLDRRILAANRAITCCTASALFVCLVVAVMFVAAPDQVGFARTIAALFIAAMALLTAGLGFFLHEIHLAIRALRLRRGPHESDSP